MKGKKTFTFKVGKPVKVRQLLGFLPDKEAQDENTRMFNAQRGVEQMLADVLGLKR